MSNIIPGQLFSPATIEPTKAGQICREQLFALETRYEFLRIDKHIIMPTHIHVIFEIAEAAEASPRPTLLGAIGVFKSLSTRLINKSNGVEGRKVWQASFYDEIIRNEHAYQSLLEYIDENPAKWEEDEYYTKGGG